MNVRKMRYLLEQGNKEKYSHLIVVTDWCNFIPEEITCYVKRGEDVEAILLGYLRYRYYEIEAVFTYDWDLEEQLREAKPYYIIPPYDKMNEALSFATAKHSKQSRKDGTPYITHPIQVAEIVKKYFQDHPRINEMVTAAYLHDTVEDTDTSVEEIKAQFGEYVGHLVEGVTSNKNMVDKIGKAEYLSDKMANMDDDTLNLKLCDRLANILDLEHVPQDFKKRYVEETIIIVSYLLSNRSITDKQKELLREISNQANEIRRAMVLKLVASNI